MKTKSRPNRRPNLALLPLELRLLLSAAPLIQLFDTASAIKVADAITLTAFVSTADGQPLDGQTLQLSDNNHLVIGSAQISDGIASFTWTPTTGGLHVLVAQLPAQDNFDAAASDPVNLNVYRRPATLNIQSKTLPGAVLLTVAGSSTDPLPFAPSGNVNLYDGSHFLAAVPLNHQIRLSFAPGRHTLSARFAGNGAFFPAAAAQSITIPAPSAPVAAAPTAAPATALVVPATPPIHHTPPPPVVFTTFAAIDIPTAQLLANVTQTPQLTLLSDPPSDVAAAAQHQFGLQSPEFRQFYEFHLPPALEPAAAQPGQPTLTDPPTDHPPSTNSETHSQRDPRQST